MDEFYASDMRSTERGNPDDPFVTMMFIVLLVVLMMWLVYASGYRRGTYAATQQQIKEMKHETQKLQDRRTVGVFSL